jgi:hypothetical protein
LELNKLPEITIQRDEQLNETLPHFDTRNNRMRLQVLTERKPSIRTNEKFYFPPAHY